MELGYFLCGLPLLAFLLDILLSVSWQPTYFRYGLPFLWQTRQLQTTKNLSDCIPTLERGYLHDLPPIIEFRALGPNEYAFREKVIASRGGLRYLHIMHGYLHFDADTQRLSLIGFAKWYIVAGVTLLLPILILAFVNETSGRASNSNLTEMLTGVPVVVGLLICYGIQVWRYHHVGKAVASLLNQTA